MGRAALLGGVDPDDDSLSVPVEVFGSHLRDT